MLKDFGILKGKTLISIINENDEKLYFNTTDGERFMLLHYSDCCEYVRIEDICGDLDDLLGSPILLAEEASNQEDPPEWHPESYTWTFYKLSTNKGSVTIRWLGESNGYYSEGVDFIQVDNWRKE